MMHALALALGAGGRVAWSPSALGASLLGFWDAERSDLITHAAGAVSSWKDTVGGYDAVQATGAAKPNYSTTSFNSRPGITFDGTDDYLELASVPFPTGATACEIWALIDQTALAADVSDRCVLSYGDVTNTTRSLRRTVSAGVNTGRLVVGSGAASTGVLNMAANLSGRHVLRGVVGATASRVDVNANVGTDSAVVPATATARTTIGANSGAGKSSFHQGVISAALVTSPLASDQAAQLYAYLNARRA